MPHESSQILIDITVSLEQAGQRIDKYLSQIYQQSRSQIEHSLRTGCISVNHKLCMKTGYKVTVGDHIQGQIQLVDIGADLIPDPNIPLDVIYEDSHLIVLNKQAGLMVHPTTYIREGTLVNALLYHYQREGLSSTLDNHDTDHAHDDTVDQPVDYRPGIVHRLDKDTTGLMLIAKTNDAHSKLAVQLQDRSLSRGYIALAAGHLQHDCGTIDMPIGRHMRDRKKMSVIDICKHSQYRAREAITHYQVIGRGLYSHVSRDLPDRATLTRLKLQTGRTHQIRVHMSYIGHPLLGDKLYGRVSQALSRQALHAAEISYIHPHTGETMMHTVPIPPDIQKVIADYGLDHLLSS